MPRRCRPQAQPARGAAPHAHPTIPRPTSAAALVLAALPLPALAQGCEPGMRPFAHAAGETCIPEEPRRIVATRHDSLATPLIELGAPLVGVGVEFDAATGEAFIRGATDILGVNVGEASGPASIGDANNPDLEALAALAPDLILVTEWQTELTDRLEQIAPTVVVPRAGPYLDHLALVADAAGVSGSYPLVSARSLGRTHLCLPVPGGQRPRPADGGARLRPASVTPPETPDAANRDRGHDR